MYAGIFDARFNTPGEWAHGVDISGYQPDYEQHPEDQFAYVKLTEGVGFVSTEAYTQVPRLTCPVGGYHFAKGRSSAVEAENYVDVVRAIGVDRFKLPHALDLEDSANPSEGWDRWAADWCNRVEQALGQPTLIYTAAWWADSRLATNIGGRELWVANYAPAGADGPWLPATWGEWAIWQWTSTPTADTHLDRNVCRPGWLARFSHTATPPTISEDEDMLGLVVDQTGTVFLVDGLKLARVSDMADLQALVDAGLLRSTNPTRISNLLRDDIQKAG